MSSQIVSGRPTIGDVVDFDPSFGVYEEGSTAGRQGRAKKVSGEFWYPDYYVRFIRDAQHFARAVEYTEMNPVAAGLCLRPEDWSYRSARFRRSADFQAATKARAAKRAALRECKPAGKP